ncbi:hypothetical protein [Microbulbifer rhizosphaerae]|uniref:SpoIIAA-like n=1 Tax=Microbulbifer rhizosphaerae TaxID=1562603 RepID=A0A7W4WDY4_9GAMM|nr:hypothetical protein [Microbulbifer rhizosphaerae]MBB3062475.1 hypothetical protein [Microbulbifer rhizosphaerae]
MKYKITWEKKLVCVDYFGEVTNKDIETAHFELNGDDRFYACDYLILNASECDLSAVSVPGLFRVIGTDLGATRTNQTLKVAMVTTSSINIERIKEYIERNRALNTPWEFKMLPSVEEAKKWFGV